MAVIKSLGQERIGDFNNENRTSVDDLKQAAADFIDMIDSYCPDGRRKSTAITYIETAQMYAVKSLFEG